MDTSTYSHGIIGAGAVPLTATQVSEIIVAEFLKRGLYDHAVTAAERTWTNSIRLEQRSPDLLC